MLQSLHARARWIVLVLTIAMLLPAVLATLAAAQAYTVSINLSLDAVAPGDTVDLEITYQVPDTAGATPPGSITVNWSANAQLEDASSGYASTDNEREVRWDYVNGLPLSNELPNLTLRAFDQPGAIDITATLVVFGTDSVQIGEATGTAQVVIVEEEETPVVADLSQSALSIDPGGSLVAGSPVKLRVTLDNRGSGEADDVVFTLAPGSVLTDVAIAPDSEDVADEEDAESGGFAFRLDDPLPGNSTLTVVLDARVAADAQGAAEIAGSIAAKDLAEQPVTISVTVDPAPLPRLAVAILETPSPTVGDMLTLSLELTNSGAAAAENVSLTVLSTPAVTWEAPEGVDAVSDGNKVTVNLPGLAAGETQTIVLRTGPLALGVSSLLTTVEVQDKGKYEAESQLTGVVRIPVQPMPTATPVPTEFPTPTATALVTPTETALPPALPTVTPASPDGSTDDDMTTLLLIGAVALVLAMATGAALLFLLRGRGKSAPARSTEPAAPVPPPAGLATTPLPVATASLESLSPPGRGLRLERAVTTIGRDPASVICIDESYTNWETVSRKHAKIQREGDDYVIYDTSNRNGVYVEGKRTARNLLRPGWRIGIGGVEFIFRDATAADQ